MNTSSSRVCWWLLLLARLGEIEHAHVVLLLVARMIAVRVTAPSR
jgi:hypothetical protein